MHAYYLQHMGIERWVLRPARDTVKKANHDSLMVICHDNDGLFEGRVGVLFSRMLQSIGLLPEQVYTTRGGLELEEEMARVKPRAILRFSGWRAGEVDEQSLPVVISYHPAHLLQCPSDKKQAYHDLLRVHAFLKPCTTDDRSV